VTPPPHPLRGAERTGCHTGAMPVLEPHPPQPQKKLLLVLALMLGVPAVVAVIASVASNFG